MNMETEAYVVSSYRDKDTLAIEKIYEDKIFLLKKDAEDTAKRLNEFYQGITGETWHVQRVFIRLAQKTEPDTGALLLQAESPPVQWSTIAESEVRKPEIQDVIGTLSQMAIRLAMFGEYLDQRHGFGCGDQGHETAVRKCNSLQTKIRRAMGYTQARNDINF